MANQDQLKILKQGVEVWNEWRQEHPDEEIDLFEARLGGANLFEVDLREADLREADLKWAHLGGANLFGAVLRGATLGRATLRRANLGRATLSGATLGEANLFGAVLRGANLGRATLRGANLFVADLEGAHLREADLSGADLFGADLFGADLGRATLCGATLFGADLEGASLVGTDLSETTITGARLYGTARDDWKIDGIKCDYVYWDREGKERTPKDRDFRPGEFEKLYKQLPTFDYFFQHGFTALDAVVMSRIVEAINEQHPEFELRLDSFHSRGQPHAKFMVLHEEYIEAAKSHVTTNYESRIVALEGKQEQLMNMFLRMVGDPRLPALNVSAQLEQVKTVEEAQTLYTLLSQKVGELRQAYILETATAVKFKLKHQIEENETDLRKIEQRLEELERREDSCF
jgi:uncharacterized protein YjbI with pentapeptide repeats